ncbi:MAG: hypothetical protein V3S46_02155 [Nitrospinota bacterium]
MNFEKKRILVTVKAYPNPSPKYSETVCCAGIELKTNKWIRLYPIPYRDLDENKKFNKYNIIDVTCRKASNDNRPESYKVDIDSIRIVDHMDTKDEWSRRKEAVLPILSNSMCEVYKEAERKEMSLALIKPKEISFSYKKANLKDEKSRKACYAQQSFFNKEKNAIEQIPFDFYYHFKCEDAHNCPGHKLKIIDWEIGQAYRDWRMRYKGTDLLLEKIQEMWLDEMCSEKKETYFFVGNMHRFPDIFLVLGTFYPPKLIQGSLGF